MRNIILNLGLAAILVLVGGSSVRATITGISSDGCTNTTCGATFVSPIVAGKQMNITVKGQFVDLTTRVEVSGSGVGAAIVSRQGGSGSHVVVRFTVAPDAGLGERTVKLRYAVELNGPDVFKVKVVRGGAVERIEQRIPGLLLGTTRLIAADSIPVNRRVTLVFTGNRVGNAALSPKHFFRNVERLTCGETRCEFELEFTQSGSFDLELYDVAGSKDFNPLLFRFYYGGVKRVTVTGTSTTTTTTSGFIPPPLGSTTGTTTNFIDVAPRANMLNIFRRLSQNASFTENGVQYFPIDSQRWCNDMTGTQTRIITIPSPVWGVSNVGTANVTTAFSSELRSGTQLRQTGNVTALNIGETRDFTFQRADSRVRVFTFFNRSGCFVSPTADEFFEDPPFTVVVNTNGGVAEAATNTANNSRNY